ncbi:MAG: glycosyltransferase family 2 protein [Anaerolineales bacterium]
MNTSINVSVIVPCYNEEKTIRLLLDALTRQTYPAANMEVIIADGMSEDRTREVIADFQQQHPAIQVRVVDNHKRVIPAALNRAIEASQGDYIIRLDAHSVPHPEYVARSVANLERRRGDNVGGIWKIVPSADTWIAKAIAAAAAHPLGVGDAKYRFADAPGEADTVPFGGFRKDYLERIGLFDEELHTNEDYELNTRIRMAGGKLWLDPNIQVQYYARPNLRQLARQYFRYGYWKVQMLRRFPGSLRWRQALPPLFVLGLLGLTVAWFWLPLAGWLLLTMLIIYSLALMLGGLDVALQQGKAYMLFAIPL